MAIYTDGQHVVSNTSLEELHTWARGNGIKRCHFHRSRWPHYDLPQWRKDAHLGMKRTTTRALIEAMQNGPILDELIGEDRAIGGLTHPGHAEPTAAKGK
jgi:hypothetical protein